MKTCVSRAIGDHVKPYVVAQFVSGTMRITHVASLSEAKIVEREWVRLDYTFNAGMKRALQTKRISP